MSYVRWSSDNYQSDVYVYYRGDDSFVTEVAARRYVFTEPFPEENPWTPDDVDGWAERQAVSYKAMQELIKKADLVDIGLEYDGHGFEDYTASECADTLEMLRAKGYRVPQFAIDSLREEAE